MRLLHIYAQEAWHGDAFIIGDRNALFRLAIAITEAANGDPQSLEMIANDGEGYIVRIAAVSDATFDSLRVPYTDESIGAKRTDGICPDEWFMQQQEGCGT